MSWTPEQAGRLAERLRGDPSFAEGPPHPLPTGPAPPVPERIGSYQIVRVLATGGMGTVYEARQEQPDRVVALKVTATGLATPSALQRFRLEAEILGRLRHTAIAQIYEAGTHDDGTGSVPFFAMELIPDARSLTVYADDRALGLHDRLELFAKVCDGVHHGHQKGIIHRDLKPANILVDGDGQPKIIDFGVARATDADVTLTTIESDSRRIIGTLQYMSPEQCAGDPRELDVRSDIYALGVVLYELLCGRLPYDLSSASIPQATRIIQDRQPTRPSEVSRRLGGGLEAIVLTALEKKPSRRYQSAAVLADDVRRYLAGDVISVHTPGPLTRGVRRVARHPLIATVAACLLIGGSTVGLSTLAVWVLNGRPYEIEVTANGREARLRSVSGRILNVWESESDHGIKCGDLIRQPGGQRIALVGYTDFAQSSRAGQLCAYDLSRDPSTPAWRRHIDDEEAAWMAGLGYDTRGFRVDWILVADVFAASDGDEIVTCFAHAPGSPRAIRIYDVSGNLLYQVWHDGSVSPPLWLPDNHLLCFAGSTKHATWLERGVDAPYYPQVVFALRPQPGHVARDWMPECGPHPSGTVEWCRGLLLPAGANPVSTGHVFPAMGIDAPNGFRLAVRLGNDRRYDSSYFVTTDGRLDAGSVSLGDEVTDWPMDPLDISLIDLPARKSSP